MPFGTSSTAPVVAVVSAAEAAAPAVTSGRLSGVKSLDALVRTGSIVASLAEAMTGSAAGAEVAVWVSDMVERVEMAKESAQAKKLSTLEYGLCLATRIYRSRRGKKEY